MLKGKNIILGVTGSIAAYKAAIVVRNLVNEGANIKIIMTPLAKEFITPLTLATLSKHPVLVDFYNPENGEWNNHVDLGLWADLFLIAPATANTIAKMAQGIADNLLLAAYLSARCPVMVAPAMDVDMFQHPATTKNIAILKSYGNLIIEPAIGELASGLTGKGRMVEPEAIMKHIKEFLSLKKKLKTKTFLVTAGPTREPIDPVRYISNYSTGKMGYAIAEEIARTGGEVHLVTGPAHCTISHPMVHVVPVITAEEMYMECIRLYPGMDVAILAAAVSDYKPKAMAGRKIKKENEVTSLTLIPTKDIAYELGKIKKPGQYLIGFALETDHGLENAREKLVNKNFDFIVLNSMQDEGAGFGYDTNQVTIMDKNNNIDKFELKLKQDVAKDIVNRIIKMI